MTYEGSLKEIMEKFKNQIKLSEDSSYTLPRYGPDFDWAYVAPLEELDKAISKKIDERKKLEDIRYLRTIHSDCIKHKRTMSCARCHKDEGSM